MREFLEKFKQYGFINFIKRMFLSALRRIGLSYSKWLIIEKEINIETLPNFSINEKFYIKEMTYIDYSNTTHLSESKLKRIKQKIDSKYFYSYGVFDNNNNIAYYCWISLNEFQFSNDAYYTPLKFDEGLLFGAFCFPKYRGNKLHNYMNIYRLKMLLKFKKNNAIGAILYENTPARKSQKNAGFECNKIVKTFNFFGYKWHQTINKKISL